jgi:signal transduction histidine kinase
MSSSPITVLLVEDNPGDARLVREQLLDAGCGPFVLTHVERLNLALQQIQAQHFDAVLLDLSLPDSQGLESLTRLHTIAQDLPVVVLSGLNDEELAVHAVQKGADDYLVKGQEHSYLARTILYSIERKRAADELRRARDELEARVQQRTEELVKANILLKVEVEERKRLEAQLVLAHKLEAIGQLAAGIAHEINSPMQYVGDNIRFLNEAFADIESLLQKYHNLLAANKAGLAPPDLIAEVDATATATSMGFLIEEIPNALQQSQEGVDRVTNIVRAMKEFSHPGTTEKTPTDLNHAIETTVTVARNEWKYVAEVVMDFDPTLPCVACLPGEFNQVILNLIVNSAHAIAEVVSHGSQQKGTITVTTRQQENWVEIRVHDTGAGIPENIRSRIFDPFFTTKPVGKGTGQGLSMAYSVIVAKHGGSIVCDSDVGKGTTFTIRLPLSPLSSH